VGYELRAVIGVTEALRRAVGEFRAAKVVELEQGLAMVPMAEALFDEVADGTQDAALGFWFLPGGFGKVLARWSTAGPLAYVEAEYFGGVGRQRAALWSHGVLSLGLSPAADQRNTRAPTAWPARRGGLHAACAPAGERQTSSARQQATG